MIEKTLRMALLFDAYGSLLTEKQRKHFALYYGENLSLGEIAADEAISRQAVYDLLRRSECMLSEYEEKLGLVAQKMALNAKVEQMQQALAELQALFAQLPPAAQAKAHAAAAILRDELDSL